MSTYIMGIDLGQLSDRAALSIVERTPPPPATWWNRAARDEANRTRPPTYNCRYLHRWQPGTHHTKVLEDALGFIRHLPQCRGYNGEALPDVAVAVDISVAGTPTGTVFDREFRRQSIRTTLFTITGGTTVEAKARQARVPKRDLASLLRTLFEGQRLKFGRDLPLADVLRREVEEFRIDKITDDQTLDWRQRTHDDLVLALAIACWQHEHGRVASGWAMGYSYQG